MRKNSRALNCHTVEGEWERKKDAFFFIYYYYYYFHTFAQQILCRFGLLCTNWSPNSSSSRFVIKRGKEEKKISHCATFSEQLLASREKQRADTVPSSGGGDNCRASQNI